MFSEKIEQIYKTDAERIGILMKVIRKENGEDYLLENSEEMSEKKKVLSRMIKSSEKETQEVTPCIELLSQIYEISTSFPSSLLPLLPDLVQLMTARDKRVRELSFSLVARASLLLSPSSQEAESIMETFFECLEDDRELGQASPRIGEERDSLSDTALHFAPSFFLVCGDKDHFFLNKLFSMGTRASSQLKHISAISNTFFNGF